MRVINLFGGPGCGKSTAAARLFVMLKERGYNVELVTEYAKDVTWERRHNLLDDQLYLFAKQHRRLARLLDHSLDYAILDSPLLMNIAYASIAPSTSAHLIPLIADMTNQYDNVNIALQRVTTYQDIGRNQTLQEAVELDASISDVLATYGGGPTLHINPLDVSSYQNIIDYLEKI